MTVANSMSILKSWGGYAAGVLVRFRALAPYALMELVLPGGSVLALLLWLYRRWKSGLGFGPLPERLLPFLRMAHPLFSNSAVCAARNAVGLLVKPFGAALGDDTDDSRHPADGTAVELVKVGSLHAVGRAN